MLFSVIITFLVVCFGLLWSLVVKLTLVEDIACVNRCPSSDYNLNNWGNLQCLVHNCLNRRDECGCKPPHHLYTIPTMAKNPVMRKKWLHLINRAEKSASNKLWIQGRQPEFARNISLMVT